MKQTGCINGRAWNRIHALKLLPQRRVGLVSREAWVLRGLQVPRLEPGPTERVLLPGFLPSPVIFCYHHT